MHSRQSVRLIPGDVWQKINMIFPHAHTHSFECKKNNATGNCVKCHLETEEERLFPQKLHEWKSKVLQPPLSELLERGKQSTKLYPPGIDHFLQHVEEEPLLLRALRRVDVQRWRDSVNIVEKAGRKSNNVIKKQLNDLFFIPSTSSPSGHEWKLQSLLCKDHQMTVGIPSVSRQEDIVEWLEEMMTSNVELLLVEEYDELLSSLSILESILLGGNSPDPLPLKMSSQPLICIRSQGGTPFTGISPKTCTLCSSNDDCIETGGMIANVAQFHLAKPADKDETIDEAPKGPLCKVIVHEVENGVELDVAASIIMVNASNENTPSATATGRPRRSRKARGDEGVYSVEEVEIALDGNLAHLRLLLHQCKGKKIQGQRLYLLHTSSPECEDAPSFTELANEHNKKTIHDIIFASDTTNEVSSADKQGDCTIHLILKYDDNESRMTKKRTRLNQEERDEEDNLVLSLSDVACGGWKTEDGCVVIGEKQTKRRRQERGFQGTFLQSTEFGLRDSSVNAQIENSPKENVVFIDSVQEDTHVARARDDIIDVQSGVEEETTKTVKRTESNWNSTKPSCEAESIDETPQAGLCKVFVHEVENGVELDVAASTIMVDVSNENIPSFKSTRRPRLTQKSRGDSGRRFPVDAIEMALDGNLAHLRLLLQKNTSKQLCGQRLFLLHTTSSECEDAPSFTELFPEQNNKSMREIIYQPASSNEVYNSEQLSHCTIHLVLSYDDVARNTLNRRKRLNREGKDEELSLLLSLTDIAHPALDYNGGLVVLGKETKRCRQERAFQCNSLQSTDFDAPDHLRNAQNDRSPNVLQQLCCSDENVFDSLKDSIDEDRAQGEEMTKVIKTTESNRLDAKPAQSEAIDEPPIEEQCSVLFVHDNVIRVSDCEEASSPAGRIRDLTSILCHVCGGQLAIDGAFCTVRNVHYCSICKMNSSPIL